MKQPARMNNHRNHEERQQREQATDGDGPYRVVAFGWISDRNFETHGSPSAPAAELSRLVRLEFPDSSFVLSFYIQQMDAF